MQQRFAIANRRANQMLRFWALPFQLLSGGSFIETSLALTHFEMSHGMLARIEKNVPSVTIMLLLRPVSIYTFQTTFERMELVSSHG